MFEESFGRTGTKGYHERTSRPPVADAVYREMNLPIQANPYQILGLTSNATQEKVKKAYFEKMQQWHPDRSKSSHAKEASQLINWAYQALRK